MPSRCCFWSRPANLNHKISWKRRLKITWRRPDWETTLPLESPFVLWGRPADSLNDTGGHGSLGRPPQADARTHQAGHRTVSRFDEEAPLLSRRVLVEWRLERQLFEDFVWKGNNPNPGNRTPAETGIVRWCLPWELLRLQRVQDAMFSRGLDEMQLVERDLHDRGFVNASILSNSRAAT